jgi:hypothetical protein
MIDYIEHLITERKQGRLTMDLIAVDAYEFLEAQGIVKDEVWQHFLAPAIKYHLALMRKHNITLAKSIDRVKVHDIKKYSGDMEKYRIRIAKKMAVYDFCQTVESIKVKSISSLK